MDSNTRRGVHYPEQEYSVHRIPRHKKKAINWNKKYASSVQGICKVFCIVTLMLAFLIIGFTPYTNPIYVLERATWPFHLVMFLTIIAWLLFISAYIFFIMGKDEDYPFVPWETREMQFNISMFVVVLVALLLEATNIWRWDFSGQHSANMGWNGMGGNGFNGMTGMNSMGGFGAGRFNGGFANMGLRPGSMSANMGMQNLCRTRPRECQDLMSLMAGINPYFGNHVFGAIMLVVALLGTLAGSIYAILAYRKTKRESSYDVTAKDGGNMLNRIRDQFSQYGNSISTRGVEVKDRIARMVNKENSADNTVDIGDADEVYGFKSAEEHGRERSEVSEKGYASSEAKDDDPPPEYPYPDSTTKSYHSSKSYNSRSDRDYAKSTSSSNSRSHRSRRRSRDYDDDRRSRRHSGSRYAESKSSNHRTSDHSNSNSRPSSRSRNRQERRSRYAEEKETTSTVPCSEDEIFTADTPLQVYSNDRPHLPIASMMV